jgi:trigger factor
VLPELDAALLGKSNGDAFEVSATFPEGHPNAQFRGKAGLFAVKVTEVKERVLPALDDELAKDLGLGFETLDALKADVRQKLEKALKEQAEVALAEQIVAKLNEKNPLDVPSVLVQQQLQIMQNEVAMQARRFGTRFTPEQAQNLMAQLHVDAEKKVRAGLLMAAIAKKQEFKVTDEDIEKAYAELAQETGKNVAKIKVEYREASKRQILIGMILEDKILDFIESKAVIKDAEPAAETTAEAAAPAATT